MINETDIKDISFNELREKVLKIYFKEIIENNSVLINLVGINKPICEDGYLLLAVSNKEIICVICNLHWLMTESLIPGEDRICLENYSSVSFDTLEELLEDCENILSTDPYVTINWLRDHFLLIDKQGEYLDEEARIAMEIMENGKLNIKKQNLH